MFPYGCVHTLKVFFFNEVKIYQNKNVICVTIVLHLDDLKVQCPQIHSCRSMQYDNFM